MSRLLLFLRPCARQKRKIVQNVPGNLGQVETPGVLLAAERQVVAQPRVRYEPGQAVGKELFGVCFPMVENQPGLTVCHQVAEAAERGNHHGAPRGHGLGDRDSKSLALLGKAWIAEDIHPPEETGEALGIEIRAEPFGSPAERGCRLLFEGVQPAVAAPTLAHAAWPNYLEPPWG